MYGKILFNLLLSVSIFVLGGCSVPRNYEAVFQNTVKAASGKVFPALVYIKVVQSSMDSGRSSTASSSGSGVVITPAGEVVTNNHVVEKA